MLEAMDSCFGLFELHQHGIANKAQGSKKINKSTVKT